MPALNRHIYRIQLPSDNVWEVREYQFPTRIILIAHQTSGESPDLTEMEPWFNELLVQLMPESRDVFAIRPDGMVYELVRQGHQGTLVERPALDPRTLLFESL